MDDLIWYNVNYKRQNEGLEGFPELFNFSSCLIDDMIVVFGGMQGIYYQSKNLYSILLPTKRESFAQNLCNDASEQIFGDIPDTYK